MTEKVPVHLTEEQFERWQEHAEEIGMPLSVFVESMVEIGRKNRDVSAESEGSVTESRQQRHYLRESEIIKKSDGTPMAVTIAIGREELEQLGVNPYETDRVATVIVDEELQLQPV